MDKIVASSLAALLALGISVTAHGVPLDLAEVTAPEESALSETSFRDEKPRGASVFVPGVPEPAAAVVGVETEPNRIYNVFYNYYCHCVWDWCVQSDWSVCVHDLCTERGC